MTAYSIVLFVHSWLRGLVLLLALSLLARTAVGWLRSRAWARPDEALQVAFVAAMDVQLLLGLALYAGLSPLTRAFLTDPTAGLKSSAIRFFGVEHVALMLIAVAVAHAGRVLSRQAPTAPRRHARACAATLLVLVLLLVAIPWPSLRYGRPLFRVQASSVAAALRLDA